MKIDIVNGDVVTDDGESYLEDTTVTTEDGLILPGLINIHAHAVCFGPLCPGLPRDGAPEERILANLDNHLLQGTTTVLRNYLKI